MDSAALQILFVAGTLCFLGVLVLLINKHVLSLKYSLLWLIAAFSMLFVSMFPDMLNFVSSLLGFQVAANALFSLLFGFVIIILLSLTSIATKQAERIKTLAQTIAFLEKRVRDLEGSN